MKNFKNNKWFMYLFILIIVMNIGEILIMKTISVEMLLIDILYIVILLKLILNYNNLKKRGIIQEKVRYIIETQIMGKKEYKFLRAYIKDKDDLERRVSFDIPLNYNKEIPNKGYVDVKVDPKNWKNYEILIETIVSDENECENRN